jgi:hypothetical protein
MYGLLLEGLCDFIKQVYGEDRWEEIRRLCNVEQPSFSVHQVYPENLLPKLAKKAIAVSILFIYSFLVSNIFLIINNIVKCYRVV